jgi:hypothetical protein
MRAGALEGISGLTLSLAAAIRARNGDLPGALAVLQETALQQHADGNRMGLGITLRRAAGDRSGLLGAADLPAAELVADLLPELLRGHRIAQRRVGQSATTNCP